MKDKIIVIYKSILWCFVILLFPITSGTLSVVFGLRTTPCSQGALDALAIDEPLEYARLALNGELQMWVDAEDGKACCTSLGI
ncbi:MAG: DUF6061 family protein [Eubacteriales bacterium]|nr:DUF6061 family protein [Eubacteriales bacterium]